jgi:hypothetical protein
MWDDAEIAQYLPSYLATRALKPNVSDKAAEAANTEVASKT